MKVFVSAISDQLSEKRNKKKPTKTFKFVNPGENPKTKKREHYGLLDEAKDWVLLCDLGSHNPQTIPPFLSITLERPDIVLYSLSLRTAILIENTSGCEENFVNAHEGKETKYTELVEDIRTNGWETFLFCVEVGARGYCSNNVSRLMSKLGFPPKFKKDTLNLLRSTAMKASFSIWLARSDINFVFESIDPPEDNQTSKQDPLWPKQKTTNQLSSVCEVDDECAGDVPQSLSKEIKTSSPPSLPTQKRAVTIPEKPKQVERIKPRTAKKEPSSITVSHPSNSPQSILSQVKSKYAKRPVGLPNQGWTCYFNASLQCFCATSELWSVLTHAVTSQWHLLKNLVLLLKLMRNGQAGLDASIVLGRLGALISRKSYLS